jgi:uncharacterized membrane protein
METDPIPFLVALSTAAVVGMIMARRNFQAIWPPLTVGVAAIWALYALITHAGRHPFGIDVAYIENAIWNWHEGRGLWSDVLAGHLYGHHAFFLTPLLYPAWLIGPHPNFLNYAHLFACLVSAIPMHAAARDLLGTRAHAWAVTLAYLTHASFAGFAFVECQPLSLGLPFLGLFFWASGRRYHLITVLSGLVVAMAGEVFLGGMILLALSGLVTGNQPRRVAAPLAAGALLILALFLLYRSGSEGVSASRHYATLGGSPIGAVRLLFSDPAALAALILIPGKVGFVGHLLLPFLGLSLLSPRWWPLLLPELILVLLSDRGDDMYKINCFYAYVTFPTLWFAAVHTLSRIAEQRRMMLASVLGVLAVTLPFCYAHSPFHEWRRVSDLPAAIREPLYPVAPTSVVPEGATVVCTNRNLSGFFPRRRIVVPQEWLSPNRTAAFASGRMNYDFLALKPGDTVPPSEARRLRPIARLREPDVEILRRIVDVNQAGNH